ncbi:MAG: HAMP domain-containing histidine kinase [Butyrivibrio sp.]|nr:HAMP domain-containing histidine kinase [Butyrivibrio sp.]
MQYLIKRLIRSNNIFIRILIPYFSFLLLNYLLFRIQFPGIVVAIILDLFVALLLYKQSKEKEQILKTISQINEGELFAKAATDCLFAENITLALAVNSIGDVIKTSVEKSIKDEKLKASLVTNVSHDIRTPLTSIINYVGLIKREKTDNPKIERYVDILEAKSNKLKILTEDLVEASKISSGNISVELTKLNFVEMINQSIGEYYEKFEECSLCVKFKCKEKQIFIMADPRHLWRIIENVFGNACKYALKGTVLWLELRTDRENAVLTAKNVSSKEISVEAEELSERFIRGDESRTTEGYGLGLSIAKSLTEIHGGDFSVRLDGDLFKAIIKLPLSGD